MCGPGQKPHCVGLAGGMTPIRAAFEWLLALLHLVALLNNLLEAIEETLVATSDTSSNCSFVRYKQLNFSRPREYRR